MLYKDLTYKIIDENCNKDRESLYVTKASLRSSSLVRKNCGLIAHRSA